MNVTFREAEPSDIGRVAVTMAPIDVIECRVAGHTPFQALEHAYRRSFLLWTGVVDGWPQAMFGVVPGDIIGGIGYPWFLGSRTARKAQRLFLTEAPGYLRRIEMLFPKLEGAVHQDNHAAIRWLQRLDFVLELPATLVGGEPMCRFHKGF